MNPPLLRWLAPVIALSLTLEPGCAYGSEREATSLEQSFAQPPAKARPWVYWFWNNGNVTKEGITADLESMQRVGLGGALIMDVVERFAPPKGPATFMSETWRDRFQFALSEAARLGLEIRMTNGPGWCGSSGPWITPELSMQKLVVSETPLAGPLHFEGVLPMPDTKLKAKKDILDSNLDIAAYYRDIAVVAFPDSPDGIIPKDAVVDLTGKMSADGRLAWAVPAGKWIIQRIGHESTGSSTRPPVLGGNGLECDKLSREAMDAHFAGMMKKLIDQAGPLAGATLTSTHIDSWEVGSQNWTPLLREEFKKRRGYDPVRFLPCVGSVRVEEVNGKKMVRPRWQVGGDALAARFRWDFQETIAELLAENYTGRLAELAHARGLSLSLEGYDLPFGDEATYTATVDEPMTEFWTQGSLSKVTTEKARQMASVAHMYGHPIVGAEAFTSNDKEMWLLHPAMLKTLGDFEFSQGVNRFVFHRFAHQPWLDRAPGATMGPWGLHYERTNTWWEMSRPWHEYLARCQFLLRQGLYVADLLYLRPEEPNQCYFKPKPAPPAGYRYDECSAHALISRVSVKDGLLTLPDGMSYRALVMPMDTLMTPALALRIHDLIKAGATVIGPPPTASPSLADYPQCDAEVARLAAEAWGACDGISVTENAFGKGHVYWGKLPLNAVLKKLEISPDFFANVELNWIHRRVNGTEIWFVANPKDALQEATCSFRTTGLQPELWEPETGNTRILPQYSQTPDGRTSVTLRFEPAQSCFIVFRQHTQSNPSNAGVSKNFADLKTVSEVTGPWELSFPPKCGAPEKIALNTLSSWSESSDNGVKYFSGTATYKKTLNVSGDWIASGKPLYIDLGDVQVMAEVTLNGKSVATLWKKPFRADISSVAKTGDNALEIKVVNLWPNRLIGDAALPENQRVTWSTWQPFTPAAPLLKSGLLGPVMLQSIEPIH